MDTEQHSLQGIESNGTVDSDGPAAGSSLPEPFVIPSQITGLTKTRHREINPTCLYGFGIFRSPTDSSIEYMYDRTLTRKGDSQGQSRALRQLLLLAFLLP